jgi:hypothetical protein
MAKPRRGRVGFVLGPDGALVAAAVIRGDVADGARFLEALRDPLGRFVAEARREAARLSNHPQETTASAGGLRSFPQAAPGERRKWSGCRGPRE